MPLLLSVLISLRAYSGPAHFAFQLLCLCCPPSLCLSCASLLVLPCEARVIVLSLCSCGLAVFLGFPPRCACAGPGVSRVVCLPLEWFLSLSSLPPLPREWSYCLWMMRRKSGWEICVLPFCFGSCFVLLVAMICPAAYDHLCPCRSSECLFSSAVSISPPPNPEGLCILAHS